MGRRLPPGEAERRAEARRKQKWADVNSGAAYKKYNPNDEFGYGSEEQWRGTAEARMDGRLPPRNRTRKVNGSGGHTTTDPDLIRLDLTAMPTDQAVLDRAYRKRTLKDHPDAEGGSHDAFLALRAAYDRLTRRLSTQSRPRR